VIANSSEILQELRALHRSIKAAEMVLRSISQRFGLRRGRQVRVGTDERLRAREQWHYPSYPVPGRGRARGDYPPAA
jgi:hypothetical protein